MISLSSTYKAELAKVPARIKALFSINKSIIAKSTNHARQMSFSVKNCKNAKWISEPLLFVLRTLQFGTKLLLLVKNVQRKSLTMIFMWKLAENAPKMKTGMLF